jgi:ligand-binding sensor protein
VTEADRKKARDDDLVAVLSTPQGRRVIKRCIEQGGLSAASHTGEPLGGAYNEGRRAFALALMLEAQRVDPMAWAKMEHEAVEAQVLELMTPRPKPAE